MSSPVVPRQMHMAETDTPLLVVEPVDEAVVDSNKVVKAVKEVAVPSDRIEDVEVLLVAVEPVRLLTLDPT